MMKDKIRIIVTDSGLGGLSFCAELAERLKAEACFREVELIFFNCCPAAEYGYQALETDEQRSEVFSRALYAIDEKYSPDLIIIACNSLSAVYKDSKYAKNTQIPVIGIIEPGAQCVSELLSEYPELNILMFATPVTVSAGIHKQIIVDAGFSPERLFYQECRSLPRAIAYGDKAKIEDCINNSMNNAVCKLEEKPFAISLFCTHFGYVRESFEHAARQYSNFSGQIIDPGSALLDLVLDDFQSGRFDSSALDIKVVSQIQQADQMKNSIISFLQDISPEAVRALRNSIHFPGLFDCSLVKIQAVPGSE